METAEHTTVEKAADLQNPEPAKADGEASDYAPDAEQRRQTYYEESTRRRLAVEQDSETRLVSDRMNELLKDNGFRLTTAELQRVHGILFDGVYDHPGTFRPYNFRKNEWILDCGSVTYTVFGSIRESLDRAFLQEQAFSYERLSSAEYVRHISELAAELWRIHPFCEGNTRVTAVFIAMYLKALGFQLDNGLFAEHAWYFRNALVRANFSDPRNGIHATTEYLEQFFENLLFGTHHVLKSRRLHVAYQEEEPNGNTQPPI